MKQSAQGARSLDDLTIRHTLKPGDAGYLTYLHAWIYWQEYGYAFAFEAYVARSFADFLLEYRPQRDRLWIAEQDGEIVGSIAILEKGARAQLRWFLIHPEYRGIGLGRRLLDEAIAYSRQLGVKVLYLSTTSDLDTAIAMYTKAGFTRVAEEENHAWAKDLTEVEFELILAE